MWYQWRSVIQFHKWSKVASISLDVLLEQEIVRLTYNFTRGVWGWVVPTKFCYTMEFLVWIAFPSYVVYVTCESQFQKWSRVASTSLDVLLEQDKKFWGLTYRIFCQDSGQDTQNILSYMYLLSYKMLAHTLILSYIYGTYTFMSAPNDKAQGTFFK